MCALRLSADVVVCCGVHVIFSLGDAVQLFYFEMGLMTVVYQNNSWLLLLNLITILLSQLLSLPNKQLSVQNIPPMISSLHISIFLPVNEIILLTMCLSVISTICFDVQINFAFGFLLLTKLFAIV